MAVIKPGDVVESALDGRQGRVVSTQDSYVNVEPEYFTSQEQWAVTAVRLLDESEHDAEALDARVDGEMLAAGGSPTGSNLQVPDEARKPAVANEAFNTVELAHPQADLVGSGVYEAMAQRADELLGKGAGNVFRNPGEELARARNAALQAGYVASEVDEDDLYEHRERIAALKAKVGEAFRAARAQHAASGADGNDTAPVGESA